MNYIVSVDVAKKSDYTAIMATQGEQEGPYDIIYLEKLQGLSYPDVARMVAKVASHPRFGGSASLLVDATGVGEAVIDLLRAQGVSPIPILFTSGKQSTEVLYPTVFSNSSFSRAVKEYHVPKQELVTSGAVLLQQSKIRMVPTLELAGEFRKQMVSFSGKASKRTVQYEASDEFLHDDLVVCYLMTAWWILHKLAPKRTDTVAEPPAGDWNPYDFA